MSIMIKAGGKMASCYIPSRFNIVTESDDGRLVIYNSISHILAVLDPKETAFYHTLLEKKQEGLSASEVGILDCFLVNNFIVPADIDEVKLLESVYQASRNSPESVILTITPTLNCNFSCHYCYQGQNKESLVMTPETQDALIKFIKQKANPALGVKQVSITWFGGEPLMGLPVIKNVSDKIIAWCDQKQLGYSAMLITNGFMLNAKTAGELYVRRVKTVQITIDGDRDTHNQIRSLTKGNVSTFDRIVGNIVSYSQEYPINTTIRVNIDRYNVDSAYRLLDQLSDAGLGNKNVSIYFAPVESSTSACHAISEDTLEVKAFSKVEYDLYLAAIKAGFSQAHLPPRFMGICGATKPDSNVITANGDIHKCWETVSFPQERIGRIGEIPVKAEIAKSEVWEKWSPFKIETCRNCSTLPNCAGFCPYKFLYKDQYGGQGEHLPCPSLKFNIKDKILNYAKVHRML
ncbi:TIGR04463 family radical SAM/SPASM RiPP maturase [uncultured Thiothrix sp.]|uniref:TIGR04463 family radical SAM/SPASM RiPP maturase n=1 Tax=uncultured Thiothrix sp. TaxID=223185 RepID=UPI002635C1CD|nr:TIGR04463 family radical SAM/SPASM RiPP maturase [uncultured Thiothrix sp.]HRJ94744.1 TIGR04463 family radical SAM/SPASM RiPP maturase [Candidatus Thiothrix moscowensis]